MGTHRGGRPRTPVETHRQNGSYRADRHGTGVQVAELVPSGSVDLTPPRHFRTNVLKDAWRSLVDPLAASGMLQTADLGALEMAAVALSEYREAAAMIRKDGLFTSQIFAVTDDGPVWRTAPNPALKIRDKAAAEYRAWCARFGLTPSDRASLGVQQIQGLTMAMELDRELGPPSRAAAH